MLNIDSKLAPFIFVIVIVICFLIIAFYWNFVSVETNIINTDNSKEERILDEYNELVLTPGIRRVNRSSKFRKGSKTPSPTIIPDQSQTYKNLHIDNLLSVDGGFVCNDSVLTNLSVENQLLINGKSINPNVYSPGNFIITETSFIEDIIPNGSLIQLDAQIDNDIVFTVNLPICDRKGLTLNIWNNTRTAKNIKCIKYIISGSNKTKFITLHPNRVLILQYTGEYWLQLQNININDETNELNNDVFLKIESIIDEKTQLFDGNFKKMKKDLEVKFDESKSKFLSELELKFSKLKELIGDTSDTSDISKLENMIKQKCHSNLDLNIINIYEIVEKLEKEKIKLKLILENEMDLKDYINNLDITFAEIITKIEGTSISDIFISFLKNLRIFLEESNCKRCEIIPLFNNIIESIRNKNITIFDKFSYILDKINKQNDFISELVDKKKKEIVSELFVLLKQNQASLKEVIDSKIKELYINISTEIQQEITAIVHNLEEKITNGNTANVDLIVKQIKTNVENLKSEMKIHIQDKINSLDGKVVNQLKDFKNQFDELQSQFKSQIAIAIANIQQQLFTNLEQYIDNIKINLNVQLESLKLKISSDIDTSKKDILIQTKTQILSLKSQLESNIDNVKNDFNSQISELESKIETQITNINSKITQIKNNLPDQIKNTIETQLKSLQTQLTSELKQDLVNIQSKITQMGKQLEDSIGADVDTIKTQLITYQTQINNQIEILDNQLKTYQNDIKTGTVNFYAIDTKYINNFLVQNITNSDGSAGYLPFLYYDYNQNQILSNNYLTKPINKTTANNTALGGNSFSNVNTDIGFNTGIGCNALRNTIGEYNTVIGANNFDFVGSYNSYLGYGAGFNAGGSSSEIPGNANYNTFVGYMAGSMGGASYNTLLGAYTSIGLNGTNASFQYSTAIGLGAQITSSNQIVIGGIYNGLNTEYPEVFIPGQLTVNGNTYLNNDLQVTGNSSFTNPSGILSVSGTLNAGIVIANQTAIPVGNAGYKVIINSSGQYTYEPLVSSTQSTVPNDSFWIVNPGYQVICYSDINFTNEVANINNTGYFSQMCINSTDTIGSVNSVMSYQIFFSTLYVETGTEINLYTN